MERRLTPALCACLLTVAPAMADDDCAALRARSHAGSLAALVPLPPRCVPMSERVPHVYPYPQYPQGLSCITDLFYDLAGNPGRVCGPVVEVYRLQMKGADCEEKAGDITGWGKDVCLSAGTGILTCDDGRIAVTTDTQVDECDVVIMEHVPTITPRRR